MRSSICMLALIIGLALPVFAPSGSAFAQALDEFERSRYDRASFYSYAEAADVTIQVSVWGAVRNPGLYEIPRNMPLNRFFSITGGPNIGDRQHERTQLLTVKLTRYDDNGQGEVIFETEMRDEVLTFEENPILQDGDVLTVERYTRQRFTWRDMIPVVGTAASLTSALVVLFSR